LISVWQLGSAHRAGYLTVIHLGSHLNVRRIIVSPFARFRSCGRACCVCLLLRNFSARPSHPNQEGPRADSWTREAERCTGVTNAVFGEADGAPVLRSERHRFSGGLNGRGA